MSILKASLFAAFVVSYTISSASIVSVELKLSGPGAVNDSTIKAGEDVSIDVHIANDTIFTGFTMGFRITSDDMDKVIHVTDSGNGLNDSGDIKGYNGWHDKSVWDFNGIFIRESNWDEELPDTIGFGGLCIKKRYNAHELEKKISLNMQFPEPGTVVIDSCFFPPGGKWLFAAPEGIGPSLAPTWSGPYKYKVIK